MFARNASSRPSLFVSILGLLVGIGGIAFGIFFFIIVDENEQMLQLLALFLLLIGAAAFTLSLIFIVDRGAEPRTERPQSVRRTRWETVRRPDDVRIVEAPPSPVNLVIVDQADSGTAVLAAGLLVALLLLLFVGATAAFGGVDFRNRAQLVLCSSNLLAACDPPGYLVSANTLAVLPITLEDPAVQDPPAAAAVLQVPEIGTTYHPLAEGETQQWIFYADPRDRFEIAVFPMGRHSHAHDLVVRVLDPAEGIVEMANDGGPGDPELLHAFAPGSAGPFTIEVWDRDGYEGEYGLIYLPESSMPMASQVLSPNLPIQGKISSAEVQYWFISGTANQVITVSTEPFGLNGRFMDVMFELYDPAMNPIQAINQNGTGGAEQLQAFRLPQNGNYILWIANRNPVDSEYVVTLQ